MTMIRVARVRVASGTAGGLAYGALADISRLDGARSRPRGGIADAPAWIADAPQSPQAAGDRPDDPDTIPEGQRNATLTSLAGTMRHRGALVGNKPRPFRTCALRGLVYCSCGTRMRGEVRLQRGTERRYDRCPTLGCHARRCPAEVVESDVFAQIANGVLPTSVIEAARTELRRRLETPGLALAGGQRARLPALPGAIAVASGARREELCRMVIERVVVRDRQVAAIEWQPPARPFFAPPSCERQRV